MKNRLWGDKSRNREQEATAAMRGEMLMAGARALAVEAVKSGQALDDL